MNLGCHCRWDSPRSDERLPQPREHGQISMKRHPLKTAHMERRESVFPLETPETPFHSAPTLVEVAPSLAVARDQRQQPSADAN